MALKMPRLTVTYAEIIEIMRDLASMQTRLSQIILLNFISQGLLIFHKMRRDVFGLLS